MRPADAGNEIEVLNKEIIKPYIGFFCFKHSFYSLNFYLNTI